MKRKATGVRQARTIRVSPLARALHYAFAASLTLAGSGVAYAGNCPTPASSRVECTSAIADTSAFANVPDLTQVLGAEGVPTSVIAARGPMTLDVVQPGDITESNTSDITVSATGTDDISALRVESTDGGDVTVSNSGTLDASAEYGFAIGIYGYTDGGNVGIDNTGTISATSTYGLADGIFASGANVDVTTGATSSITANGFNWAAGIEAQGDDLTTVTNSGDISAVATANDETNGIYGNVFGIYATGGAGGVNVSSSGNIPAEGVYATGVFAQGGGPITISNTGDITVGGSNSDEYTTTYLATGIDASNSYENSAIAVDNSGSITANGYFDATGISVAASGTGSTASVTNGGAISASSGASYYSHANGIIVSGDAGAYVHNTAGGTISASASANADYGYGYAYGVQALTFNGDAIVVNDGSVTASADNAKYGSYAFGVAAFSATGTARVTNTGDISAYAASQSFAVSSGIYASGVAANVVNTGLIETYGGSSLGIDAAGTTGDVTVLNQGSIHATGNKYSGATGISASSTYGDVSITNGSDGEIVSLGEEGAYGIQGRSFYGDVNLVNAGSIELGTSDPYALFQPSAIGMYAASRTGNVSVVNSGTILAQTQANPTGIRAFTTGDGTTTVDNSGVIQAISDNVTVWGIDTGGYGGGDISVHNSGTIEASTGSFHATGIWGYAGESDYDGNITLTGDVSVYNEGTITVSTFVGPFIDPDPNNPNDTPSRSALLASTADGVSVGGQNVQVTNAGSITADAFTWASGLEAYGAYSTTVTNSGDITVGATANGEAFEIYGDAFGIYAIGGDVVQIGNSGTITATSDGRRVSRMYDGVMTDYGGAAGIFADSTGGDVTIGNSGEITATNTAAYGVANGILASAYGDVTINNSGDVLAVANNDHAFAAAVSMQSVNGTSTLNNAAGGSISVDGTEGYAWAVMGSDGVEVINNSGLITGAISLGGGDDVFGNDGVWDVGASQSTDFGAGDDSINNLAGGVIRLDAGAIGLGDGNDTFNNGGLWDVGTSQSTDFGAGDDSINNLAGGVIRLDGGAIHLGSSVEGDAFNNAGTIQVLGDSLIDMGTGPETTGLMRSAAELAPSLNSLPLVNTGIIDFLDGAPDDTLTIVGDLGGNGNINLDLSPLNQASDQLYVDGSLVDGAVQTVNVTLAEPLTAAHITPVVFGHVSGNSSAGSFVGGQVIGATPGGFLDLGVSVSSQLDASNATDDLFSFSVDVNGLNDTGTLAASVASGAATMLNDQIGTMKQRLGVNPYGDEGKVLSAFVRGYGSEGDVDPTRVANNFGQTGNFAYHQSSTGQEVGIDANVFGGFHAGLVLGHADGTQRLAEEGVGVNRFDGMTFGFYATWFASQGFYVDLSGREMAVDVQSTSAAGTLTTQAHTSAANIEAGYAWTLDNGLAITPQLQYTRTKVEEARPLHGDGVDFLSHGGTSSRGRLGVEASKEFQADGGVRITPYGSLNAVREFDGEMSYTVADAFSGSTDTKGTSAMAELGLGVQTGAWGFTFGAHWTDGGAFKGVVGGQAVVRFAW